MRRKRALTDPYRLTIVPRNGGRRRAPLRST